MITAALIHHLNLVSDHRYRRNFWRMRLPGMKRSVSVLALTRKVCRAELDRVLGELPRDRTTTDAIRVALVMHLGDFEGERILKSLRSDYYAAVKSARNAYLSQLGKLAYDPFVWPENALWPEVRSRYLYGQTVRENLTAIGESFVRATSRETEAGKAYLRLISTMRSQLTHAGQLIDNDPVDD
jgi:hypothetical protein